MKIKRLLTVCLVLCVIFTCLPATASAASYPFGYTTLESSITIPEGEVGKLELCIFPEFKNEEYHVYIYDSKGNLVGSAEKTYYNSSTQPRYVTITVDTNALDMEVGTYEAVYWFSFYSLYEWHDSPNSYTHEFKVIPNLCYGNHDLQLERVVTEGTCKEEGTYKKYCTKCEYTLYVDEMGDHTYGGFTYLDENTHKGTCSECSQTINMEHNWDDGVVTKESTFEEKGEVLYTCKDCGGTKTETTPKRKLEGWVMENGNWVFYENGVKVTNAWRKDSKGWCYLGSDGAMLTNCWLQDSKGWCYIGADGYCETNCWKRDSYGLLYLDSEGSMTKNQWICTEGKWYYLDSDGYAVTDAWRRDSYGWCYLGSDGAMVTNCWLQDSKGWCYIGADGYCETNCWKKDSYGWLYLDSEGSMTKDEWILDNGDWYYLDEEGYMVTGEENIHGTWYTFNDSGVWVA